MIELTYAVTTAPDFSGFNFYVEAGREFDANDYAEAYNLNPSELNPQHVHWAQGAAARLNDGEWLLVTHEATSQAEIND